MELYACSIGHAIVGGSGHLGSRIALQLKERGCDVVVVESDPASPQSRKLEAAGCRVVIGDVADEQLLDEVDIASAGCFIAVTGNDQANLEAAVYARQRNETCSVVVRLYDHALARRVERTLNVRALSASQLASPAYVSAATDESIVSVFAVDDCCLSIRHCAPKGWTPRGVFVQKDGSALALSEEPGEDMLFVAAAHSEARPFFRTDRRRRKSRTLSSRLRASVSCLNPVKLARKMASFWRQAPGISRSLLIWFLAAGAVSVGVFSYFGHMKPLDALYFVATTMTTVGYGDFNLQSAPAGLKAFGVIMMLTGAALLATIYAIIADRVLAARVEYLLGRRQVDCRDHTVVVGLGKVGFRVAHDLKMLGLDVVGVESNEDVENLASARAMFPVVVGDASKGPILTKTAIERAASVLLLTDNTMLNLGVALHTRELNPAARIVIRTYEDHLAEKLRSFGFDDILSTSAIASPAFVDAAVYPGVLGSFTWRGEDVLIARHIIQPNSPLASMTVRAVGDELGMAVVLLARDERSEYELARAEEVLFPGRIAVIMLSRERVSGLFGHAVGRY